MSGCLSVSALSGTTGRPFSPGFQHDTFPSGSAARRTHQDLICIRSPPRHFLHGPFRKQHQPEHAFRDQLEGRLRGVPSAWYEAGSQTDDGERDLLLPARLQDFKHLGVVLERPVRLHLAERPQRRQRCRSGDHREVLHDGGRIVCVEDEEVEADGTLSFELDQLPVLGMGEAGPSPQPGAVTGAGVSPPATRMSSCAGWPARIERVNGELPTALPYAHAPRHPRCCPHSPLAL